MRETCDEALRDALMAPHGNITIRFAPKIDSRRERRLRCAAALADVETLIDPARNCSRSEGAPDAVPSAVSMNPGSPMP